MNEHIAPQRPARLQAFATSPSIMASTVDVQLDASTVVRCVPCLLVTVYIAAWLSRTIWTALFGPLSHFPGPRWNAISSYPYLKAVFDGEDANYVNGLHEHYGNVVRVGPKLVSFVGSTQVWKDIHGFQKAGQQLPHKSPAFYAPPPNGVPSLLSSFSDAQHARQRRILAQAFSDTALKEQEPLLKRWAGMLLTKLHEQRDGYIDMLKMLNCTTFDIMADLTFAEPLFMLENNEYSPWVLVMFAGIKRNAQIMCIKAYSSTFRSIIDWLLPRVPAIRRKVVENFKFCVDRVDRRLSKPPSHPDFWSRILDKSRTAAGGELTRNEQYSNSVLLMVAGTETTATALSGALFYLAQNSQVLKKVTAEVRTKFPTFEDLHLEPLAQCKYLEAVLKEALRLYPPVPIGLPRSVPGGGAVIGGHFVPEGTRIQIPQLTSYRIKSRWVNGESFVPERWLGDERYARDEKGAWEPFSIGPRGCLGKVYFPASSCDDRWKSAVLIYACRIWRGMRCACYWQPFCSTSTST
jgi:cytochrome P450